MYIKFTGKLVQSYVKRDNEKIIPCPFCLSCTGFYADFNDNINDF